jgi:hypothetical protein
MRFTHLALLLFVSFSANAQSFHELNLQAGQWNIKPRNYYYTAVEDERAVKESPGVVLENNKTIPVKFKKSLEADLLNFINGSVDKDTSLVPLVIGVRKFSVRETGTTVNHTANFEFEFAIYRIINNKKYSVYESQGNPVLTMKGAYENPHERNISETIKSILTKFNDYTNTHAVPLLARKTKIFFEEDRKYSDDTIPWNPRYKLTWADFKGTPSGSYMAESNCVFDYRVVPVMNESTLELHIYLNACFDKKHSWVQKGQEIESLLAHEQLHFDICQACILKIRRAMQQAVLNPIEFDSVLRQLFENGWNDYQKQSEAYDRETEHGTKDVEQNQWATRIRKEVR